MQHVNDITPGQQRGMRGKRNHGHRCRDQQGHCDHGRHPGDGQDTADITGPIGVFINSAGNAGLRQLAGNGGAHVGRRRIGLDGNKLW